MDTFYNHFNEKADELFKDLIDGFPKDPNYSNVVTEFRTFKSGFTVLKNIDFRKPQRVFRDYVVSTYREKIENKDETFFLESNEFEIASKRVEYWMEFISQLRVAWGLMDTANKEIIWKYFKLLVFLSDKCDSKTI